MTATATDSAVTSPRTRVSARTAVVAWVGIIVVARLWAVHLTAHHVNIVLFAAPLLGRPHLGLIPAFAVPVATAALLVKGLPIVARRLSWRGLLVVSAAAAAVWTIALALGEGFSGLTRGVADRTDYLHDVPFVRAHAGAFIAHFTRDIGHFEIQTRGHPPGMVLLLAGLAAIGLGGAAWEAALVIAAGASASAAVLIAVREVADEFTARRVMPWVILTPAAIFVASSADALYMAISAWSVALVIIATGRHGLRSTSLTFVGGVVGGFALMGSYGMLLGAAPALVIALHRRRYACLLVASAGAGLVLLAFLPFGFWWLDGLRATLHEYRALPIQRPYAFFAVNNLAAWALALGPAIAVALVRLRDRRLWLLVGAATGAAVLADISGLSRGEVERIWLPFTIWVAAAGAALTTTDRSTRSWLSLQAVSALAIIAVVKTQW